MTRERIASAARDLFYHKGYTATSYADVAEQTGLGKGNIQYHFNSKDDLLTAAVEKRLESIGTLLERWTLECKSTQECLDKFISMVDSEAGDLMLFGCPMGTLNGELGKSEKELQLVARKMFDLFLDWLEMRFRELYPDHLAREKAEFLLAMAQGVSVLAHAYGDAGLVHRQVANMREWLAMTCAAGMKS